MEYGVELPPSRKIRTVFLGRHAAHIDSILTLNGNVLTFRTGERLFSLLVSRGETITNVICSPRFRAVATGVSRTSGYCTASGIRAPVMHVDSRLDSFESEGVEEYERVKALARSFGLDIQSFLLGYPDLEETMIRRGREGAEAVLEWLGKTKGVLLFESHGGSRLEAMLAHLKGDINLKEIDYMFERSALVELTFIQETADEPWLLNAVEYHGFLESHVHAASHLS